MSDSLGDRMKGYENVSRIYLPRRLPVIIRVDGRAFHTFTKGFQKPFDNVLSCAMRGAAIGLCKEISGAKLAFVQSDEISVLVTNNDSIETQPWFDNNLQKLVSLSASIATRCFDNAFQLAISEYNESFSQYTTYFRSLHTATFDARAFVLPPEEVVNYFIWRQQDATRNSVQMVARSLYSHKELMNKNSDDLQEMIHEKGVNWNDYPTPWKRGICCVKTLKVVGVGADLGGTPVVRSQWELDTDIPIFTQDRDYIERWLRHDDT